MKTTLLITTFNRGHLLKNSLERLTYLTKPDEVLIVDDGSVDNTKEVVDSFVDKLSIKYIYNHNPEWSICSQARNIGIKNATGDIIVTSEPEMLWVTDILKQALDLHKKYPDQLISAGIIYHPQSNCGWNPGLITQPEEVLKDAIVETHIPQPRSYHPSGYVRTVNWQATYVALYEKKWLMDVGGWDEAFPGAWGWDDVELATRLRINGINQHISADMQAIHQPHESLPPHLHGPASKVNEDYFKSKKLDLAEQDIFESKRLGTYTTTDPRLVANKGFEWGVVKPR